MKKFVWVLEILSFEPDLLGIEPTNQSILIFTNYRLLKTWLVKNYFVFGYCTYFNKTDKPYWFHQKDRCMELTHVLIFKTILNNPKCPRWIESLNDRSGYPLLTK